MARPWIEFVQSQKIAWRGDDLNGLAPRAEAKVLSSDDESGAASLVVRYPAGFHAPGRAITADEEFVVLDGSMQIRGVEYAANTYGHLPAHYESGDRHSPKGAVVLTFFSSKPSRTDERVFNSARLVTRIDILDVPYTANFHPEFPPGAGRKMLYQDPITNDASWILGTLPMRWAERSEVHPTVEEMYLISGESHGDRGVMRPGAYFWRPPGRAHGPYGTLTGNVYFFRTKGGSLTTNYVAPVRSFRWWPDYDPVLPPEHESHRGEWSPGAVCW